MRTRASGVCRGSRYSLGEDACARTASSTCAKAAVSSTKTTRRTSAASASGSGKRRVTSVVMFQFQF